MVILQNNANENVALNFKKFETEIYSIAFGGDGIGKADDKICFIPKTIPGEKIFFKKVLEKKNYIKGILDKIIIPSKDRINPKCKYYALCGGCQYQHLKYDKELYFKKQQVIELLAKIGKINNFICCGITPSNKNYNYRESVTLHKSANGYGFYATDNHTIITINDCSILSSELNQSICSFSNKINNKNITVKKNNFGNIFFSSDNSNKIYTDRYFNIELFFSPKTFSQTNRFVAEKIVEKLNEWINSDENTTLFDAYCGVGFFTFLINKNFKNRIGIESNPESVKCANLSAKNLNINNVLFFNGKVEDIFFDIFNKHKSKKNILLIDPPRSGLNGNFLTNLINNITEIQEIYYLSCDPAKLARDAKIFNQSQKWKLEKIHIFDMFPRTKHIETLAKFC